MKGSYARSMGLVLGLGLLTSSVALAQADPELLEPSRDPRLAPKESAPLSEQRVTTTPERATQREDALGIALGSGIDHAAALQEYADNREDAQLDQSIMNDHLDVIGRSLETADQQSAKLEQRLPSDTDVMETFETMNEKQTAASEPYRALLKEVAKPEPSADAIEDSAEELKDLLKEADDAYREIVGTP
jgi:hypothetical protein